MVVKLEEMKLYLKEDGNDEEINQDIKDLIEIAETYLINAGCVLKSTNGATINLAKLAVKQLVVHWYENREPIGKADRLTFSLDNIITQLKYCYGSETQ